VLIYIFLVFVSGAATEVLLDSKLQGHLREICAADPQLYGLDERDIYVMAQYPRGSVLLLDASIVQGKFDLSLGQAASVCSALGAYWASFE